MVQPNEKLEKFARLFALFHLAQKEPLLYEEELKATLAKMQGVKFVPEEVNWASKDFLIFLNKHGLLSESLRN